MIARGLALVGALCGSVALSQYPAFSQQYLQRLSGAVDELRGVVVAFDTTARLSGLTRDEALRELRGTEIGGGVSETLSNTIRRYERLEDDYARLSGATSLGRLAQPWRFRDTQLVERTWDDFEPAVPASTTGLAFAGAGFVGGWALVAVVLGLLTRPFRRRRRA
ncbi:MAG: DUF2937 family protein [Pseudomonadota bacterium]